MTVVDGTIVPSWADWKGPRPSDQNPPSRPEARASVDNHSETGQPSRPSQNENQTQDETVQSKRTKKITQGQSETVYEEY